MREFPYVQREPVMPSSLLTRRSALTLLGGAASAALLPGVARAGVDPIAVFGDPDVPVLGNAEGDVAVAVWFDYRCPFCRKAEVELMRVVQADGRVAVLLKDWPIFGKTSERAARIAWSARRQGVGAALHAALMEGEGRPTDARVDAIVERIVPDRTRLDRDVAADRAAFDALVARNAAQADAFRFPGTPAYVIGSFVFPGVLDEAGFTQAIADTRAKRG